MHEFVGGAGVVGALQGRQRIDFHRGVAAHRRAIPQARALPPVVAIHAVVAAGHRRELRAVTDARERGPQKPHGRLGRSVAAVEHRVQHHPPHSALLCHRHQRHQVRVVRMDAAIPQQSQQVEGTARGVNGVAGLHQSAVLEEAPVFDRAADPHQILHDDPAGP